MKRETRVSYGRVPRSLFGPAVGPTTWQMLDEQFLLRGEQDHYFHYRKGSGVTIERGAMFDLSEEALWLNGSVYGAIASMNGLLPIHASAVARDGQVFAFTGPAGAGKSTLVAGLARRGLPMFCDDTLVLDLSESDRIICLPGHKRLKLRPDAVEMTGAIAEEKVSETVDKLYAAPAAGDVKVALPLGQLIFLEIGDDFSITQVNGAERLLRLQDDHQTAQLFAGAQRFDRSQQFAHLARLARQIDIWRFVRPVVPERFDEGVAFVARHILNGQDD